MNRKADSTTTILKDAFAAMSAEETEAYIREEMRVCLNRYVGHPISEKSKTDMVKEIKKSMYELLKSEGGHHISIKLSEDGKSILWKSKEKNNIGQCFLRALE